MSLGKLPGIKGLVSGSQGKRRFKNDLSVDMISPPLGDFRHTMHVGRGGDVFGDTSFLSNHGGAGSEEAETGGSKTAKFFSRTLRHVRKAPVRPRGGSRDLASPPPPVSPIIKNAISLPQLNLDNGCLQRALFSASPSCPEGSSFSAYGLQSGFVTLPRLSRADRQLQDCPGASDYRRSSFSDGCDYSMPRSDSMTSFTVDLGPSLMSEVFSVIDSPNHVHTANHSWADEEEDEEEEGEEEKEEGRICSTPELPADAPSINSPTMSLLGQNRTSRGSSRDGECGAEEDEESNEPLKMAGPNEVTWSPSREDPGMEPERFKMAANVLARHYSTHSGGEDHPRAGAANNTSVSFQKRAPYAYPEDEDEIKV